MQFTGSQSESEIGNEKRASSFLAMTVSQAHELLPGSGPGVAEQHGNKKYLRAEIDELAGDVQQPLGNLDWDDTRDDAYERVRDHVGEVQR